MKLPEFIRTIFFSILFVGCENIDIVDTSAEFTEYLVVRAELKANTNFEGVQITKTLPLDEAFSINKAEIRNAAVQLKVNGHQVIPLHYTNEGIYKSIYDVQIVSGYNYELIAKVGEKSIYGNTRVPEVPDVQNISFESEFYLTANVTSKPNEVYGAVWAIVRNPNEPPEISDNFFSIVPTIFKTIEPRVAIRTTEIPENLRTQSLRNSTFIKVTAFDSPYLDYFKTRNNDQPVNNAFVSGGGAVGWNVQGDKVIGMFIGIADGNLMLP
jgi:hypothetical protein